LAIARQSASDRLRGLAIDRAIDEGRCVSLLPGDRELATLLDVLHAHTARDVLIREDSSVFAPSIGSGRYRATSARMNAPVTARKPSGSSQPARAATASRCAAPRWRIETVRRASR
jgi:hypothetical protein